MGTWQKIFMASALTAIGTGATGAGMSGPTVRSALGQPLDFALTVWGDDGGEDLQGCIGARVLDGASEVPAGDVVVEVADGRSSDRRTLTVRTRREMHEPTGAVTLTLGCNARLVRRFEVLVDPLPTPRAATLRPEPPWAVYPHFGVDERVAIAVPTQAVVTPTARSHNERALKERRQTGRHRRQGTALAHRKASAAAIAASKPPVATLGHEADASPVRPTRVPKARLRLDYEADFHTAEVAPQAGIVAALQAHPKVAFQFGSTPSRNDVGSAPVTAVVPHLSAPAYSPDEARVAPVQARLPEHGRQTARSRDGDGSPRTAATALTAEQADRLQWLEFHTKATDDENAALRSMVEQLRRQLTTAMGQRRPVAVPFVGYGWKLFGIAIALVTGAAVIILIRRLQHLYNAEVRGAELAAVGYPAHEATGRQSDSVVHFNRPRRIIAGAIVKRRGVTLIELVIAMALLAILIKIGLPAVSEMVANAKVRTTADILQNALRSARAEALRQNRQGVLALTTATPSLVASAVANGPHWFVFTVAPAGDTDGNSLMQVGSQGDESNGVTISGPAALCFNSNGRLTANATTGQPGATCAAPSTSVSYDVARTSATHPLRVVVTLGGQVRMCDPARSLAGGAPDGC